MSDKSKRTLGKVKPVETSSNLESVKSLKKELEKRIDSIEREKELYKDKGLTLDDDEVEQRMKDLDEQLRNLLQSHNALQMAHSKREKLVEETTKALKIIEDDCNNFQKTKETMIKEIKALRETLAMAKKKKDKLELEVKELEQSREEDKTMSASKIRDLVKECERLKSDVEKYVIDKGHLEEQLSTMKEAGEDLSSELSLVKLDLESRKKAIEKTAKDILMEKTDKDEQILTLEDEKNCLASTLESLKIKHDSCTIILDEVKEKYNENIRKLKDDNKRLESVCADLHEKIELTYKEDEQSQEEHRKELGELCESLTQLEENIREKDAEMQRLTQNMADLQQENISLLMDKKKLHMIDNDLDISKKECEKLHDENEQLKIEQLQNEGTLKDLEHQKTMLEGRCEPSRIVEPYQAEIAKFKAERDIANNKATELENNLVKEKLEAMSDGVYNNMKSCTNCEHIQEELLSLKKERNSLVATLSVQPDRHELAKKQEDEIKKLRSQLAVKTEKLRSHDKEVVEEGEQLHKTLRDKINELDSVKNLLLHENSSEKYQKTIAEKQHDMKILKKKLHVMNSKLQNYSELKSLNVENVATNEKLKAGLQKKEEEVTQLQKFLCSSEEKCSQQMEEIGKQNQKICDLEIIVETDNATISTLKENISSTTCDCRSGSDDDDGLEQHMEQLKTLIDEKDEQISDLSRRYGKKSEQLKASLAKQEQVLHEKLTLKKKFRFLQDHMKTKEGVITELGVTMSAQEKNITQLEEIVSLSKNTEPLSQSGFKDEIEKLQGDNKDLQGNLTELSTGHRNLKKEWESLRKDNCHLKEEQEQNKKHIQSLESQLKLTSQHVDTWKKASLSYDELRKESLKFLNEMSNSKKPSIKRRNSISGPTLAISSQRQDDTILLEDQPVQHKSNSSVADIHIVMKHINNTEQSLCSSSITENSDLPSDPSVATNSQNQEQCSTPLSTNVSDSMHYHRDESGPVSTQPSVAETPVLKNQSFSSPAGLNCLSLAPVLGGGRSNTPIPASPFAKRVQNLVVNSPPPPRLHPSQRPTLHKHRSCPEGLLPNLGASKPESSLEELFDTISEGRECDMFSFDDPGQVRPGSGSTQEEGSCVKPTFTLGAKGPKKSHRHRNDVEFDLDEDVMFEFAESECEREASNETSDPMAEGHKPTQSHTGFIPIPNPLLPSNTDTPPLSSSASQTHNKVGRVMSIVSPFSVRDPTTSNATEDDGMLKIQQRIVTTSAASGTPLCQTHSVVSPVSSLNHTTPLSTAQESGHISIPSPSKPRCVFDDNSGKVVSISGVQPKRSPIPPSPMTVAPSLGIYQKVATFADAAVTQAHKALCHIRGGTSSDPVTTRSHISSSRSLSLNMSAQLQSSASQSPCLPIISTHEKYPTKPFPNGTSNSQSASSSTNNQSASSLYSQSTSSANSQSAARSKDSQSLSSANSQSASSTNSQSEDADSVSSASHRVDGETRGRSVHRSDSEPIIIHPSSRIPRFQSPIRQQSPARNNERQRTHSFNTLHRPDKDDCNSGSGASSNGRSGSLERRSRSRTKDRPSSVLGTELESNQSSRRNSVSKINDSLTFI